MSEYFFILGNTPVLSKAEIEAVLKGFKADFSEIYSSDKIFHVRLAKPLDLFLVMKILGGTVKIAQVKGEIPLTSTAWKEILGNLLIEEKRKPKIEYGISFYEFGNDIANLTNLGFELKTFLKEKKISARLVLPREGFELKSVVVAKQKLTEIVLVYEKDKVYYGITRAVQDFEAWSKRDFGRPAADSKKGMLAPKVARMMVNLTCMKLHEINGLTMLDPFCGVGTILAEAMLRGLTVIGCDIDSVQVKKTITNLTWITSEEKLTNLFNVFEGKAEEISKQLKNQVDMIVTEPYLGPPEFGEKRISKTEVDKICNDLNSLYSKCLEDWLKILKSKGIISIILPSFDLGYLNLGEVTVKKAIDNCENLGYNLVAGPYKYHRPNAVVIRNIFILQKK